MRDSKRIDTILERIRALWKLNPDTRLCQLISNIVVGGRLNKGYGYDPDIFHVEDDVLEEYITTYEDWRNNAKNSG